MGGKTGVNHPGGKNLIGAFHQPVAVVADTDTLATLPPRELRAGLAEVIKYGLICDAGFFAWLEAHIDALLAGDAAALARVIRRSCEIKAEIVGRDEREQGDRALLNLGHTFGHAVESATGYKEWLHGEAIGAGLVMAACMSRESGYLTSDELDRVTRLVARAGLPTHVSNVKPDLALELMRIDKKVQAGRIRLVLLRGIGGAFVTADYGEAALRQTLRHIWGRVVSEPVSGGEMLAPYAARDDSSRGRRYPEPKPEYRTEYQRDRDRIIHSNAFRRLVYKTQVFVNHEGDLYRTRVTHSIEVAQIARSVARALGVNEALTEAICLAHDLGHTPFGHAGQDALERVHATLWWVRAQPAVPAGGG